MEKQEKVKNVSLLTLFIPPSRFTKKPKSLPYIAQLF